METIDLIKAAISYVGESVGCKGITAVVAASEVKGEKQESDCELFDHEFVDQHGSGDYGFYGTTYLPLPNGEYLALEYYD